jgi:hypothetical protein
MSLWTPDGERQAAPQMTPEQHAEAEAIAAEMAEVRAQLLQVPAAQVVANHAMGCYELAAIHLSNQPPTFSEAQVAIDAFGALVDVLEGKLGPDEVTLRDALAQLRLAFVQVKASYEGAAPEAPTAATGDAPTPDTTEEDGGD